jgi:hypothetical protein
MVGNELILTVITSAGGASAIILGLSAWIGKVWASRIIEAEKASHSKEIEVLRSSLELNRTQQIRNSEAQFRLYSEVWNHLQDVKSVGDRLWEKALKQDVESFVKVLANAKFSVNRGRLILKETHYQQLQKLFNEFDNYQIGKERLIEIRSSEQLDEVYRDFSEYSIRDQINENRGHKEEYEKLLEHIITEFRKQLGITA